MVAMQFLSLVLGVSTDSSVTEPNLCCFFGDNHGGEAMVGRRDAYWASGGSTVTNSLLLSVLWALGMFVANQIALVLGRTMQSVGGR